MKETTFSKIKKGQFFYFPKGKTEFVFNGGGPKRGYSYECQFRDERRTKTDRKVLIEKY